MRSDIAEAKDDLEKIEFVIGLFEQNKSDMAIDRALASKDVQRKLRRARKTWNISGTRSSMPIKSRHSSIKLIITFLFRIS